MRVEVRRDAGHDKTDNHFYFFFKKKKKIALGSHHRLVTCLLIAPKEMEKKVNHCAKNVIEEKGENRTKNSVNTHCYPESTA